MTVLPQVQRDLYYYSFSASVTDECGSGYRLVLPLLWPGILWSQHWSNLDINCAHSLAWFKTVLKTSLCRFFFYEDDIFQESCLGFFEFHRKRCFMIQKPDWTSTNKSNQNCFIHWFSKNLTGPTKKDNTFLVVLCLPKKKNLLKQKK